jgi:hypothetical protein
MVLHLYKDPLKGMNDDREQTNPPTHQESTHHLDVVDYYVDPVGLECLGYLAAQQA